MRIGEIAKKTGLTTDAVRFYEKEGLLPAGARRDNQYREYGPKHVERLFLICRLRALSLSLEEIRDLLAAIDSSNIERAKRAHSMLDKHLALVDEQINELQLLKNQMMCLKNVCTGEHEHPEDCALLNQLVEGDANEPKCYCSQCEECQHRHEHAGHNHGKQPH